MDACSGVDVELDKVQAKFTAIRQSSIAGIDEVLQTLEAMKSDLQRNAALLESEGMFPLYVLITFTVHVV